jgi:putative transposase
MTALSQRGQVMSFVAETIAAGARQERACEVISLSERTLQRWQNDKAEGACDRRPARVQTPKNRLDELERQRLLAIANSPEYGHLPPSQIVPRLVDRGEYVASESIFYRVLKAANQLKHRGAEKPAKPRHKPRALAATAPGQLFSWDITYLPTPVMRTYFYLHLFMDIYSRKVVGRQVYQTESSDLASEVMRDIVCAKTSRRNRWCCAPITAAR